MQRQALTEVKIFKVNGVNLPGLLKIGETGKKEDPIEVPEPGITGIIGSGQKKLSPIECEFLIKRDSTTLAYVINWDDTKDERDVVFLVTDRTGLEENWFFREIYSSCGIDGVMKPDFDQASRKYASLKFSLLPYRYDRQVR